MPRNPSSHLAKKPFCPAIKSIPLWRQGGQGTLRPHHASRCFLWATDCQQGSCLFVAFWSWQRLASPSCSTSAGHQDLFPAHHLPSSVSCETAGTCGGASMGCCSASHQHMGLWSLSWCVSRLETLPSQHELFHFSAPPQTWVSDAMKKKCHPHNYLFFTQLFAQHHKEGEGWRTERKGRQGGISSLTSISICKAETDPNGNTWSTKGGRCCSKQ